MMCRKTEGGRAWTLLLSGGASTMKKLGTARLVLVRTTNNSTFAVLQCGVRIEGKFESFEFAAS